MVFIPISKKMHCGETMRILLVEDEKHLALPLAQLLEKKNFEVECVFDGQDGLDYGLSGSYDAIVLDIMLPKLNGLQVVGRLREAGIKTPILLLTAKGEDTDIVAGLEKGADDYLPKPFSSDVLVARLRAITRRKGDIQTKEGALFFGNIRLNVLDMEMEGDAGRRVSMSRKETLVMEYLVRKAPEICDKRAIFISAWGHEAEAQDSNVEVYISFLRRKLEHINANCRIANVRGLGYRLEAADV